MNLSISKQLLHIKCSLMQTYMVQQLHHKLPPRNVLLTNFLLHFLAIDDNCCPES